MKIDGQLTRSQIAWRVAQELQDGMYINLGVGLPTLTSLFIPNNKEIIFHSENGILGVGSLATEQEKNPNLVNATQQMVTIKKGGCFFDCCDSFAMLRGGHIDLALLGAFEVSARGDLANWNLDQPETPPAVGGVMDIVAGTKEIWVLMEHCTRKDKPRLVTWCSYPLTAAAVVKRIFTDLAVIRITATGFLIEESIPAISFETLQAKTAAPLKKSVHWKPLVAPPVETEYA